MPRHAGRIAPQAGCALELARGEILRVIDPRGEQVADLFAFASDDRRSALSSGRSIDYAGSIRFTTGSVLYAGDSRPLLTIVEDSVGRHDFLLTPCSLEMFALLYEGHSGYHPSCLENLATSLAPYGVQPHEIGTTFNIFMNVAVGPDGAIAIGPPLSRPGDSIVLRAERNLLVGLTACSAEKSNNHSFKPIDYEIHAS